MRRVGREVESERESVKYDASISYGTRCVRVRAFCVASDSHDRDPQSNAL